MPCTHARFDHLQHYYPNNVALAKCKPIAVHLSSDCSTCNIISHNRGKERERKKRTKQTSRNGRVHLCWATREPHSSICMYTSKRDEPKRGPGQHASRTNTKNRPFTAERAFETRHQITLLPVAAKRQRAALLSPQGNRTCDNVLFPPPLPRARACRRCVREPAVRRRAHTGTKERVGASVRV